MTHPESVPHHTYEEYPVEEMKRRAAEFSSAIRRRRTVRDFSDRPVSREVIEDCLRAAGSAPSGANMQPWHFVAVGDAALKRQIRLGRRKPSTSSMSARPRRSGWTRWPRWAPARRSRSSSPRRI